MNPESLRLAFDEQQDAGNVAIGGRAWLLRGLACSRGAALVMAIREIADVSPFRHMVTQRGCRMSVALTSAGVAGWVSDRKGYRYDPLDPDTGRPWPAMPALFSSLASEAAAMAGFSRFRPDTCLINRYLPGAQLSLHQDRNEVDFSQPVVSVSLGLPARFLWGGMLRADRVRRIPLMHGDVVVWGGEDRLRFHGVHPLAEGTHPLTDAVRYNITFRRAL